MSEKLTREAIEEMVTKAKAQAERMIETMLRRVVADFESADSEDFKLALTIEGQRKRGGGQMTLQTKAQSTVDLKRKDQTQADVIDWGPTLFDKPAEADIPEPEEEEPEEEEEPRGPKLLCSASPVFDPTVVDAEFTVTDEPAAPPAADETEDTPPEVGEPEDQDPETGDSDEDEPENEQSIED